MAATLAEWLGLADVWGGLAVGLVGGIVSGLLGVSSGGILVPGLALVLGMDQHRAQAVSLIAQLLPTGLPGVIEYHRRGHAVHWPLVLFASLGFLVGAYGGARAAGRIPEQLLRWMFADTCLCSPGRWRVARAPGLIVAATPRRALGQAEAGLSQWSERAGGSLPGCWGSAAASQ